MHGVLRWKTDLVYTESISEVMFKRFNVRRNADCSESFVILAGASVTLHVS